MVTMLLEFTVWVRTRAGLLPRGRGGQAMIEYVVVAVALLAAVAVLAFFLYALRLQADRTLTLVSSDYP